MIPRDFEGAYEGLVGLVGRISAGEAGEAAVREEVDRWRREDCRGAAALTKAATSTLRYELASRGLEEGPEAVSGETRALGRVETILNPPEAETEGSRAEIVEVALPERFRQANPRARGYRMGPLQIIFEPTEGPPHGHLSVSHPDRYPTWEEIRRATQAPGGAPPNLWALVPKAGQEGTGLNRFTVHLYILPPEELLG